MVLQAKADPKAPKEKKEEKSKTPNSSLPKPGPSGTQFLLRYGLRSRGRPLGATTRKTAPPLDHTVIAHRTRQKTTETTKKNITPRDRIASEPGPSSNAQAQSTPVKESKNELIDVSLGPQFNQSSSMMSSTGVEESDESTDQPPPLYDPRRSGLRLDDPEVPAQEEDETEEANTSEIENDDKPLSNAEIEVTAPAVTESELEGPASGGNTTQEEVFDSAQKFEESLRVLMEKTQNEAKESFVVLPKHFSGGDDVDDFTRSSIGRDGPL